MIYRFNVYSLNPHTRELRRSGELQSLSPKVFDCIVYLIEHRDRAVGRDELIAAVWGKVDVADVQLGQLMRKVRHTIADEGENQCCIRTIPRFGFRWMEEVEILARDADERREFEAPPLPEHAVPALDAPSMAHMNEPAQRRRLPLLLFCAGLVAAAVAIHWLYTARSNSVALSNEPTGMTSRANEPLRRVIAVLPAEVAAATPETSWIRLGIMDLIATRLRNAGITVLPTSNVLALARDADDTSALYKKVRAVTSARDVVIISASRNDQGWQLHMELRSDEHPTADVEAFAPEVIAAATEATDRLSRVLGVTTASDVPRAESTVELLQRAEALFLTDDFLGAERKIEAAPADVRELPEAQLILARISSQTGHIDAARERFSHLVQTVSVESAPGVRMRALIGLGTVAHLENKPEEAEKLLSEAIAMLESRNEPALLGNTYGIRAVVYTHQGHYDEAAADFGRARTTLGLAGDSLSLARVENNEANLAVARGARYADAIPLYQHAAEKFLRFGATEQYMYAVSNRISAHISLLQIKEAIAVGTEAAPLLDRIGDSTAAYMFRYQRACALVAGGWFSEARTLLDPLMHPAKPSDISHPVALAYALQADMNMTEGHTEVASELAIHAVDVLQDVESMDDRARSWLIAIRALRSMSRLTEAATEVTRFSEWASKPQYLAFATRARLSVAEQAWAEDRRAEAMTTYDDALSLAIKEAVPANIAEVVWSYGNLLIDQGELVKANEVVGQVARWSEQDFHCALLLARLYQALGRNEAWRTYLDRARSLGGERKVPPELSIAPKSEATAL